MGTWGCTGNPVRAGFSHMRCSGAVVPLPVYVLQDEHSFLYRHKAQTCNTGSFTFLSWRVVVSYSELHLWFSKPPLPQPGHLDTAVILAFNIPDFPPSVDMWWARYFQGRKGKSGNDAGDKSGYCTPNPQRAFDTSLKLVCSLSSLRVYSPWVN